jgi:predicted amidohydrolase YtcJ
MTWAEDRVGPDRIKGAYAWRTMRKNGVRLLFNSDLPGSDWDIFYGLHAAITRRNKERQPEEGWYPEQAMTPEEAVRGYTTWGAYFEFLENETGVIRPGMRGDLTVLSIDPFVVGRADPDALLDGKVLATVVGGKVIHRAEAG